jgi:hypothetical protein
MTDRTELESEALAIFREIGDLDARVCKLLRVSIDTRDADHDERVYLNKTGDALMAAQAAIEVLMHPDDSPNERDMA